MRQTLYRQGIAMRQILSNRRSTLKWLLPLAAGFLFVVLGFPIYKVLNPRYPRHIIQMSQEMRVSSREAADLDYIHQRAASGETPTDRQWRSVKRLVANHNIPRNRFALLILGQLNKTRYRQEAVRMAEGLLNSPDSRIKAMSITTLARLRDGRWKGLALQNQHSHDPILRTSAVALLE